MDRRISRFVLLGLSLATVRGAAAQRPRSDSVLVRVVMEATLAGIGPELADRVFHPAHDAWRLAPPDTTDSLWSNAFRGLKDLLQGRDPQPGDDRERYLEMHETHESDSLRVFTVEVGQRRRCPHRRPQWVGPSRTFEISVAYRYGTWQVMPASPWIDGLPGVCEP